MCILLFGMRCSVIIHNIKFVDIAHHVNFIFMDFLNQSLRESLEVFKQKVVGLSMFAVHSVLMYFNALFFKCS